jgi:hypothetical protein
MNNREDSSPTARERFTRGLRNHRKREASVVKTALTKELALIGLLKAGPLRLAAINHDTELWLREKQPTLVEFGRFAEMLRYVNKAIAARVQNRRLTLRVRAVHEKSSWSLDFEFCDLCAPLSPEHLFKADGKGAEARKAKGLLKGPRAAHARCEEAGLKRGLAIVHGYRMRDVCERMGTHLFHARNGIKFGRRDFTGLRLQENLKQLAACDPFLSPKHIGDLFKVAYAGGVLLHLRVAAVDGEGEVSVEYGGETVEVGSGSDDPAERDGSLVGFGALVALVSGSPPGVFRLAEG